MRKFDLYLLKDLLIACLFITITLAAVIFLTQSLRFLELVINSGASSGTFWILTFLALPRFFEIILPLALMTATIFVFHRMIMDSELVAIKAAGFSPARIARSAILLGGIFTAFLWFMTMWAAPVALNNMQKMQEVIKAQFSSFLFQEGVFNSFGSGITFYISERANDGSVKGLLIHDKRDESAPPSTIMAQSGTIRSGGDGYEIVVYDGTRQVFDPDDRNTQRLNFDRYTIALPDSGPVRKRWREPDERTIFELLNPDYSVERNVESRRDFIVEIHRRLTAPIMTLNFVLIAVCGMLLGPASRRGCAGKIAATILICIVLQGLYLAAFNLARQYDVGFILMYGLIAIPFTASILLISGAGEKLRRNLLYNKGQA